MIIILRNKEEDLDLDKEIIEIKENINEIEIEIDKKFKENQKNKLY